MNNEIEVEALCSELVSCAERVRRLHNATAQRDKEIADMFDRAKKAELVALTNTMRAFLHAVQQ